MSSDSKCLFCKIIAKEIPCSKVYEDEHTLAFLDINPLAEGHTLVIPKYHAQKTHELPTESMVGIGKTLSLVSQAVVSVTGVDNYNILQNNGRIAHQEVDHVHFHIIPKKDESTGMSVGWSSTFAYGEDKFAQLATAAEKFAEAVPKSK